MTASETRVAERREAEGFIVIKMDARGNPDFLLVKKEHANLLAFEEVKSRWDTVKRRQARCHAELRAQGFNVRVTRVAEGAVMSREQEADELTANQWQAKIDRAVVASWEKMDMLV